MTKAVSAIIATVLLIMMTVAAAAGMYYWYQSVQGKSTKGAEKEVEKFISIGETKMSILGVQADSVLLRNVGEGVIGSVDLVVNNELINTFNLSLQPGKTATLDLGRTLLIGKTYDIKITADNGVEVEKSMTLRTAVVTRFKDYLDSVSLSPSDSNSILVQKGVTVKSASLDIYPQGIETGADSELTLGNELKVRSAGAFFDSSFDTNSESRIQYLFLKNELYTVNEIKKICFQKALSFSDSEGNFYIDSNTRLFIDKYDTNFVITTTCTITNENEFRNCNDENFEMVKLFLYSSGVYGTANPFTIRMCQTDSNELNTADFDTNCQNNSIKVYENQNYYEAVQGNLFDWLCFDLDTDYEYDPSANLIVEMNWTGSSYLTSAELDTNYLASLGNYASYICSLFGTSECEQQSTIDYIAYGVSAQNEMPFFFSSAENDQTLSQCCHSNSQFKVPSKLKPNIKLTIAPVSYLDNFRLNLGLSSILTKPEVLTPLQAPLNLDFKDALQAYLGTCTADSSGLCEVPLSIANYGSDGKLRLENLKIELTT